jgi:hypothetical protein
MDVIECPACRSALRAEEEGGQMRLFIVRVEKPDVPWAPTRSFTGSSSPAVRALAERAISYSAADSGMAVAELQVYARDGYRVAARRRATVAARATGASLPLIGELLERDHTTVISALRASAVML